MISTSNPAILLAIGGVLLIVCLACVWKYVSAKRLLDEMWAVDTYEAKELRRMCSGGFDATVEVQGTVTCDQPLVSLAANVPCCWFHTTVEREERKTRTVTETDSRGNRRTRTETYYEWQTDFSESFSTLFKVHDPTGYALVDPTNADIDAETVYSRVIMHREPWFLGRVWLSDTGKYRITEKAFLPQGFVYVLGQASSRDGEVLIRYPSKGYLDPKRKLFVISRKSEEELTRAKQSTASVCFWFAIVALLGAAVCVFLYLSAMPFAGLRG